MSLEEVEDQLIGIWKEVLSINEVNPEQNFFDLGGDSIKAMTLARRIKKTFQIKVPIVKIFSYPNIKKLAVWICESKEVSLQELDSKMDKVNDQINSILNNKTD